MVFLTSISPRHILEGRQQEATRSWLKHGRVISMNHPSEIEVLKTHGYDEAIEFIPTFRTQHGLFGKHYVCLNALTDYVKEHRLEQACVINSDISIMQDEVLMENIRATMATGFVYLHRHDFDEIESQSLEYRLGVDAFFFSHEMADLLPQTVYCLGHCYFDIWLPYFYLVKGYTIISYKQPVILHKKHNPQYSHENWHFMGTFTSWITGFGLRPGAMSDKIYNSLKNHTVWK